MTPPHRIFHKTVTINIADGEWLAAEKYGINVVAALHDGLTAAIKKEMAFKYDLNNPTYR